MNWFYHRPALVLLATCLQEFEGGSLLERLCRRGPLVGPPHDVLAHCEDTRPPSRDELRW